jgi:hypothetical protein
MILWLLMGSTSMAFKFRSAARDQDADARRLGTIEQAIVTAIADAEAEQRGLMRRLEPAQAQAAMLLGNDAYDSAARDPAREKLLQQAEATLMGQRRANELRTHIAHLRQVLDCLKTAAVSRS